MALTTLPAAGQKIRAATVSALITEVRPIGVRKSGDQSVTSSTVLVNDSELTAAVVASALYKFTLVSRYDATTASDFKTGFSVPSGTTMNYVAHGIAAGGTVYNLFDQDQTSTPTFEGAGAGTIRNATYVGTIVTSSTAGSVNFQFAQGTSGGTASISKAGSLFVVERLS